VMCERASPALKLTIVRGGGLAGITRQTELASEELPPDEATKLRELIEGAGLLDEEAPREAPPTHPDELSYEVIVEVEGRARTLRFTEQTLPDAVRLLIASIDSRPESRQSIVGR
jgi:Emfourin